MQKINYFSKMYLNLVQLISIWRFKQLHHARILHHSPVVNYSSFRKERERFKFLCENFKNHAHFIPQVSKSKPFKFHQKKLNYVSKEQLKNLYLAQLSSKKAHKICTLNKL